MKQIHPLVWVGSQQDVEQLDKFGSSWAIVYSGKDPWHRQLLGYKGVSCPEDHPERLWAQRDNRLYLNLVDAPDPKYFTPAIIKRAVAFIDEQTTKLSGADQLLIVCNQGKSRSAMIGMLYLAPTLPADFAEAEDAYRIIYPDYAPGNGAREFARIHWRGYHVRHAANKSTSQASAEVDTAQKLWIGFCQALQSDPTAARDQLIDGIRTALLEAKTLETPTNGRRPNSSRRTTILDQ